MNISAKILEIDELLEQLDAFAASNPRQAAFWTRWLTAICKALDAVGASLILDLDLADLSGVGDPQGPSGIHSRRIELSRVGTATENPVILSSVHEGIRCRLQSEIYFQDSDSQREKPPRHRVANGFLEVAQKYLQSSATARNAATRAASDFQLRLNELQQPSDLDRLISEDLCGVLLASQVSVVRHDSGFARWVATTGVPQTTKQNTAVKNIESQAESFRNSQARLSLSPLNTTPHRASFLLESADSSSSQPPASRTVLVEWTDADTMLNTIDAVVQIIPALCQALTRIQSQTSHRSFPNRKTTIALVIAATLFGTLWFAKDIQTPHLVDASGLLHPVRQKVIYSNCVGYVDAVYTDHEEAVKQAQTLLQLRSPDAELKLQELDGELAGATQQREGLRLTLNQAKSSSSESQAVAFQLSSEIAALDAKLAGLSKQKEILLRQIESYQLTAPLDGTIITRDLKRNLLSKPVVLGEPLLRVCDTKGPWILRLEVDPRDIAPVQKRFQQSKRSTDSTADQSLMVAFRLASEPDKTYFGQVTNVDVVVTRSSQDQHPTGQAGNAPRQIVRVEVDFDKSQMHDPQIDASVIAKIDCGKDFWWRNWSRQLVDALRRRFWINV